MFHRNHDHIHDRLKITINYNNVEKKNKAKKITAMERLEKWSKLIKNYLNMGTKISRDTWRWKFVNIVLNLASLTETSEGRDGRIMDGRKRKISK